VEAILRYFGTADASPRWRAIVDERWEDELVASVCRSRPRRVVDAGCGDNRFKGRIPNLLGIDIANPHADLMCDMVDAPISPSTVDVVLALGSINFGSRDYIARQLEAVRRWLRPGGQLYIRVNPGIAYPELPDLVIYPWTVDEVHAFARRHRFRVAMAPALVTIGNGADRRVRLFWRYEKE
jgi:SAM-dependent methyltransferase